MLLARNLSTRSTILTTRRVFQPQHVRSFANAQKKDEEKIEETPSSDHNDSNSSSSSKKDSEGASVNDIFKKAKAFQYGFKTMKAKYLGAEPVLPRLKTGVIETTKEMFGLDNKKSIDSTLTFRSMQPAESSSKSSSEEQEDEEKDVPGGGAVMIVKDQGSAWERIGARLKETPIIQGIMDAAKKAAATEAGKKVGAGASKAKNKIGDATEDAREFWETSQNPWVYRLSSLYDGFFGETAEAAAIREIRRTDPSFILEQWKEDVEAVVVPEILSAFLQGDSTKLKGYMGEAAYNTVNHAIRERKTDGLVVDPTILAVRNCEVIAATAEDKHSPMIVIQFMAQQINCIKNREGEIVEGSEDEVRAVYYALAFQRNYDEDAGVLQWKIVEMAMLGAVPYV